MRQKNKILITMGESIRQMWVQLVLDGCNGVLHPSQQLRPYGEFLEMGPQFTIKSHTLI